MPQGASQEQGQHAAPDACEAYLLRLELEMVLELLLEQLLERLLEQKAQDTPLEGWLFCSYREGSFVDNINKKDPPPSQKRFGSGPYLYLLIV